MTRYGNFFATARHVIGECFEMRIAHRVLLDVEKRFMQDAQEPTTKPRLVTFIPSRCGVGFLLRQVQESHGQAHGDISFKSDSIS